MSYKYRLSNCSSRTSELLTTSWGPTTTDQTVSVVLDRVTVDEVGMNEEEEVSQVTMCCSGFALISAHLEQVATEVVDQDEADSTLV